MKGLEKNTSELYIEELDERIEFFFGLFGHAGGTHSNEGWTYHNHHNDGDFYHSFTKFCKDNGITKDNFLKHCKQISDWCSKNYSHVWHRCSDDIRHFYDYCYKHVTKNPSGCEID